MKALLVLVALLASACGDSPLDPSPALVSLGVRVVTNSGHPVVNELVALTGRPNASVQPQRTDANGLVQWRIESGHVYAVVVRHQRHFEGVRVTNDSQWLLSLPE
jgi:hypothetical protein